VDRPRESVHVFKCLNHTVTTIELRFVDGVLYGILVIDESTGLWIGFGDDYIEVSPIIGNAYSATIVERGDVQDKIDRILDDLELRIVANVCEEYEEEV